ncbi:MAG: sugar phosphate nucleotidyltransferase [Acidobacteriota bacterium]
MERKLATVIMAAGKGTRMKNSEKAKVMFEVCEIPMIEHVVRLAYDIHSSRVVVIVGFKRESVIEHVTKVAPLVEYAVQEPQLGTGHAIMQTEALLGSYDGDVLVLSGDVPLLQEKTIEDMISHHHASEAAATILTADVDDPTGYGRVLRNGNGYVEAIVEHRDATPEQLAVKEINSGIYIFNAKMLYDALHHIDAHNAQNEYYLTDVFGYFWKHTMPVSAVKAVDHNEIRGINTIDQLVEAESVLVARGQ